jgi:threonine/homoserine efflux transporter RhtA
VPAVSAVAGVLLYNETLTIAKIIGITAVVLGACGIIIVQKNKRKGVENVKIIS